MKKSAVSIDRSLIPCNATEMADVITDFILTPGIRIIPFITGLPGGGKTDTLSRVAKILENQTNEHWIVITIAMGAINQGELPGVPITAKSKKTGNIINTYTTHDAFEKADRYVVDGYNVILFFDEANRCETAVNNELMTLFLNKELHGHKFDRDKIFMIAAGNPANISDYTSGEVNLSGFNVNEYDMATESRFCFLKFQPSIEDWFSWAVKPTDDEILLKRAGINIEKLYDGSSTIDELIVEAGITKEAIANVDSDILDFLSENPEYFHLVGDGYCPNPRSWAEMSLFYKYRIKNDVYSSDPAKKKKAFVKIERTMPGSLGMTTVLAFINFLKSDRKPTLKGADLFESTDFESKLKELNQYNPYKQSRCMDSCIGYLFAAEKNGKLKNKKDPLISKMSEIMDSVEKDIKMEAWSTLSEMGKTEKSNLHVYLAANNPLKFVADQSTFL